MLGLRGTDDGTDRSKPRLGRNLRTELIHHRGQALVKGRLWRGLIEKVGSAGVGGTNEHEQPGAGLRRPAYKGRERIAPERAVEGCSVRAQAFDLSERARGRAEQRIRVRGCAHRHVAALSVGDNEESGPARGGNDTQERLPTWRTKTLKACELRLDRHTGRARGGDDSLAPKAHCLPGTLGGRIAADVRKG